MNYKMMYFLSFKALVLAIVVLVFGLAYPSEDRGLMGVPLLITLGIVFCIGLQAAFAFKDQEARIARLESRNQDSN